MPDFKEDNDGFMKKPKGFKMSGIDFGEGTGRNLDFGEGDSAMTKDPKMQKTLKRKTRKKPSYNVPTKSQVDLWKQEFMALDDPMESNRGKALANKLMDAGIDPSTYA